MTTSRPRGWPLWGLLCVAAAGGCRPANPGDGRPLTLVLSGDTAGWLVPCGCTSNQSGGLLRRGSYVRQLRGQGHVLVADVGGATAGRSPYDLMKFEAILEGERAMGVVAHNLGAAEAALGAATLRRLAERSGFPLLSANLCDQRGRLVVKPLLDGRGRRADGHVRRRAQPALRHGRAANPSAATGRARRHCRPVRPPGGADCAGLLARGRTAAACRVAARGRRGGRRSDRATDVAETDRADAVDFGHQAGQVSRPARRPLAGRAQLRTGAASSSN